MSNENNKSQNKRRDCITVRELAREIMPHWEDLDWFEWFPDIFFITSKVMQISGAYRFAVEFKRQEYLNFSKKSQTEKDKFNLTVIQWKNYVLDTSKPVDKKLPEMIGEYFDCFWNIEISFEEAVNKEAVDDELLNLSKGLSIDEYKALFTLHALADTACASFGIPTFPSKEYSTIIFWSNLLLVETGSLSRLPKRYGVVLPKMRTPQSGLTLRSFSHHLTFHKTEVSIKWRSIPWMNQYENTINIMVIPVPYRVTTHDFEPLNNEKINNQSDPPKFRYFDYDPKEKFNPDEVVGFIQNADVEKVHVLVFPEASLKESELRTLKGKLLSLDIEKLPLIIAGVRNDKAPDHREADDDKNAYSENYVELSIFFAGKWYELKQYKHHRWKLNTSQIEQYSLASRLHPNYEWWEGINIRSREITFLCPDDWLTLCPLICEDLAQLEPVSTIIRGVGPTLVTSILSDGPQITDRWSARYVGVLADDPGTSILTLTSLGMAKRSRVRGKGENKTVALWKDQLKGWETIELAKDEKGALLTTTSKYTEEFTADGRTDNGNAANVILHGYNPIEDSAEVAKNYKEHNLPYKFRRYDDEELSILVLLVDSILSWDDIDKPFLEAVLEFTNKQFEKDYEYKKFVSIKEILKVFLQGRDENSQGHKFDFIEYKPRIKQFHDEVVNINKNYSDKNKKFDRWNKIHSLIDNNLSNIRSNAFNESIGKESVGKEKHAIRLFYLLHLTALWSLHKRLQFSIGCLSNQSVNVLLNQDETNDQNIGYGVKDRLFIETEKLRDDTKKDCRELLGKVEETIKKYQKIEILRDAIRNK